MAAGSMEPAGISGEQKTTVTLHALEVSQARLVSLKLEPVPSVALA